MEKEYFTLLDIVQEVEMIRKEVENYIWKETKNDETKFKHHPMCGIVTSLIILEIFLRQARKDNILE